MTVWVASVPLCRCACVCVSNRCRRWGQETNKQTKQEIHGSIQQYSPSQTAWGLPRHPPRTPPCTSRTCSHSQTLCHTPSLWSRNARKSTIDWEHGRNACGRQGLPLYTPLRLVTANDREAENQKPKRSGDQGSGQGVGLVEYRLSRSRRSKNSTGHRSSPWRANLSGFARKGLPTQERTLVGTMCSRI